MVVARCVRLDVRATMGMLWAVLYWGWIASEAVLAVVTRTKKSQGSVEDRGSLQVLWATIIGVIWFGSWWAAVHGRTMLVGAHWVRTAAVGVMAVGLAVRWVAIWTLGRAFSVNVAIHTKQELMRTGLYAVVRHPSYTGMVLIFVALGMGSQNWVAAGIFLVPTMAALVYRMRVEEAALGRAFGAEYADYCRGTKRLVPGVY